MKEPQHLAEQLHVLITMDERTHIITREQALMITAAQNSGAVKTFSIGNCPITLHQVSSIPTLDVYRRQMKTKLAERNQRMCRRCGAILHMADRCSCRDSEAPALFELASKENPKLREYLSAQGLIQLTLPEPKPQEVPLLPPTPKEREQMRVIQQHKDRFLGKASMELPPCETCKNERQYLFQGVMVKCDCTMSFRKVDANNLHKAEHSGTLQKVSP